MADMESALSLARQKLGETTSKYGFPGRLGWKSTDTTTIYNDATGGKTPRYRVRLGTQGEVRVLAVVPGMDIPDDVYDLEVRLAYQDGTLVLIDWDKGSPLIPPASGGNVDPSFTFNQFYDYDHNSAVNGVLAMVGITISGLAPSLCRTVAVLNSSTFVVIYRSSIVAGGANIWVQAATVDGAGAVTWGTPVAASTVAAGNSFAEWHIVQLTSSTFAINYRYNTTNTAFIRAGSVSGTTITLGAEVNLSTIYASATTAYISNIGARDENSFWLTYMWLSGSTYRIGVYVIPVSGTTIGTALGDEQVAASSAASVGNSLSIAGVSGYSFIISTAYLISPFIMNPSTGVVGASQSRGLGYYFASAGTYTQAASNGPFTTSFNLGDGVAGTVFSGQEFGYPLQLGVITRMTASITGEGRGPHTGPVQRLATGMMYAYLAPYTASRFLYAGSWITSSNTSEVGVFDMPGTQARPSTLVQLSEHQDLTDDILHFYNNQVAMLDDTRFVMVGLRYWNDRSASNWTRLAAITGTIL